MCAINGIFSIEHLADIMQRVKNMNDAVRHRGPDGEGVELADEGLVLGHRRLAILDLDVRSNQPMKSVRGNVLVFNGEIYNYREIKKELSYPFKTECDTEVLLAAIEEKGIEWCLEKCNGMFAFAFWDCTNKNLILARDRIGIKPFYFCRQEKSLVFSSEIKGILSSGLVEARFNELAVDEYLANRYVRAPYTFFENIMQIMPGQYLVVNVEHGGFKVLERRFWRLPDEFNMDEEYDEASLEEALMQEVTDAIKRRMIADVPLGTYLSGGVDSSLISAITALNKDERIHTYTIGFDELNEFEYARMVSEQYNTIHHEILMNSEDYFGLMEKVILFKDAPLGVPNEIPLAVMSEELKKEITVVLSGEGADELMGGYGRIFRSPFDYQNLKIKEDFYQYFIEQYEYVPRELRDKYLTVKKEYRDKFDSFIQSKFAEKRNEENVFRFFHQQHVQGLLQRVDTTTMLASVEARVPFLDHQLIEFVYRNIPYGLKLHWNQGVTSVEGTSTQYSEVLDTPKYLLKKVALQYLPETVVTRKKVGFPVPLNHWVTNLEEYAGQVLEKAYWLDTGKLKELLSACQSQTKAGQIIWMFLNVEIFRKLYFEKEWRY